MLQVILLEDKYFYFLKHERLFLSQIALLQKKDQQKKQQTSISHNRAQLRIHLLCKGLSLKKK